MKYVYPVTQCVTLYMTSTHVIYPTNLLHGKSEVGNCIDVQRYVDLVTNSHLVLIMVKIMMIIIIIIMMMLMVMAMMTLLNTNN